MTMASAVPMPNIFMKDSPLANDNSVIVSRSAALLIILPTLPSPITPSVCRGSSIPANAFLPSSTVLSSVLSSPCRPSTNFSAGLRLRAAISMPAITSSFTALALPPGALNTGTPRLLSFSTGMLLTPAPARPTAFTLGRMSIACMSCERTRIASGRSTWLPTS